jgi:hypothetical protein
MEKSIMSLLEELESRGVTAEDLEKAASVRLFEKAAAAEGVDLDLLDVDQVEDLYAGFLSNQPDSGEYTKEASAMNDEIVDLFEKTAAAEGIDLDEMADDELAELYTHYVENVLPEQLGEGEKQASDEETILDMFQKTAAAEGMDLNEFSQYELQDLYGHYVENVLPLQLGDKTAAAEVGEAQEKLAEAEILGRHMARSYADELDKLAGARDYAVKAKDSAVKGARRGKELLTASSVRKNVREQAGEGATRREKLKTYGRILRGGKGMEGVQGGDMMTLEARRSLRAQAGAAAAATGTGYGAKKMYDRKKGQTKKSSAFDEVEIDALMKIASEFGYDVAEKVAEEEAAKKKTVMDCVKGGATYVDEKAQGAGRYLSGIGAKHSPDGKVRTVRGGTKIHRGLGYGVPTVAAGGLAYGAKKLMDRRKAKMSKKSSAYDYEDVVNEVALDMLADAGFDV